MPQTTVKNVVLRELAWFFGLLAAGLILMPVGIYVVGESLFGAYGGHGYADFFGTLSGKIRGGDGVAWFLVSTPYLLFSAVRLTRRGWRRWTEAGGPANS